MKLKISNRADAFFELFVESGENLRSAAELLQDLIGDFRDVPSKVQRIADREHEGDEVTHAIIRLLNTTFVTPMDREDIYQLATALDDVLDELEAVSDLFVLHRIETPLPEMKAQIDVLVLAARQTEQALAALPNMKREELEPYWIEINRLENEGDQLYRRAIADLFSGEHRAMDVLRWKEVIENLEEALDGLENVANIIESTILKHT